MIVVKGDVYLADLNPQRGTEPGKVRPVVVVQTDLLNNHHPSTLVCPITANIRLAAHLLRVHLGKGEAGLTKSSDVMVDQLRAIDNRRFVKRLGSLFPQTQKQLHQCLLVLLN
jgi:mRNA interferase MazF